MAFTLDLIKPGDGEATRYSLEDGSYIIGRGASCALQLPELEVSERHALLMLRGHKAASSRFRPTPSSRSART